LKGLIKIDAKNTAIITVVAVGFLLPVIMMGAPYPVLVSCNTIIFLIAVSGFDVLVGFTGQISLGHAAYYCLGAYISAMLHAYVGIPVFFSMIIASVAATVIGSLIAWPTTKLVEHFMALATIAFSMIVFQLVNTSPGKITGDINGFRTVYISFFGYQIDTYIKFYYFAFSILLILLLIKYNLLNSRVGRAMLAIRENDHAANGMGVNVRFYKIAAFAVSVFFTAYAGAMFAHLMKYISPDSFRLTVSIMFLTMLLFGGSSSMAGPILGVTVVSLLNEVLRPASSYKMLVYGILLLFVILVFPGGLMGVFKDLEAKFLKKRKFTNKE
jgi:branched-chain amino acid transport system permease protein